MLDGPNPLNSSSSPRELLQTAASRLLLTARLGSHTTVGESIQKPKPLGQPTVYRDQLMTNFLLLCVYTRKTCCRPQPEASANQRHMLPDLVLQQMQDVIRTPELRRRTHTVAPNAQVVACSYKAVRTLAGKTLAGFATYPHQHRKRVTPKPRGSTSSFKHRNTRQS
jgi:hypothetical protein